MTRTPSCFQRGAPWSCEGSWSWGMGRAYCSCSQTRKELPNAEDAERAQRTQKGAMATKELTGLVIGAAIEVQRILGPGLLESAYSGALAHELELRQLRFEREVPIPANYK